VKFIFNILFFFLLNLTQAHAQAIVRTFNSDAFVTAYINGYAYGYDAEIINRQYASPKNSCIYQSQEKTKDGAIITREEVKTCHEEISFDKKNIIFEILKSPLGETLMVLTMATLAQRLQ
jgi:hypothetical protein